MPDHGEDVRKRLVQAIADPGSFVVRGGLKRVYPDDAALPPRLERDAAYGDLEPLVSWQARAVAEMLGREGDDVFSNTTIGDKRLTWREVAEREREEVSRLRAFQRIVTDLDRCEHGRHEGDICSASDGCGGPSKGHPTLREGDVLGYALDGHPYVVPPRAERYDPRAWGGARHA